MAIYFQKTSNLYGCFSNFFPCTVDFDGLTYRSSEAAWQAQKTLDPVIRKKFTGLSASESKRLGRQVALRSDWEDVKYQLMVDVCYAKFSQNKGMAVNLLSTGENELVENTTGWHDNIWGSCFCSRCRNIDGRNLLGKALMEVREKLRAEMEA